MLKTLEIRDYALIGHINVEFGNGLNIITGETGAGKSILIDAMSLLLGERASTEVVRRGTKKSVVEGIFDVEGNEKVKNVLDRNDIDFEPELIVRREISLKGSNRCFVNDTPVSLSLIKAIGDLLVDLHGQHEHQSLLHTETHIDFLDEFGNYDDLLTKYKNRYDELIEIGRELETLSKREAILAEKKEIYSFGMNEIDNVSPEAGEEEKLIEGLKILEHSEKLAELSSEVYQILYDGDKSVHDSIVKVKNDLSRLTEIDKSFTESSNEAETILALINDISSFIRSYKSKIDLEPQHIEEVRERLGAINMLKKKYGGTIHSVLVHRKKIGEEFELAENYSERITELNNKLHAVKLEAGNLAKKLSEKRKTESLKIKKGIEASLKELGISHPKFKTVIESELSVDNNFITIDGKLYKFNSKGVDRIEFFISTNQGEEPKPLAKVASGGEISRIMLSLKTILARNDKLPVLIFDEIDTGVSGRIAQKVGSALKNLAAYHQIIAITHLPQIAGLAENHFSVEKFSENERVTSTICRLTEEERIKEVARLMSGEEITETNIKGAKQLMGID